MPDDITPLEQPPEPEMPHTGGTDTLALLLRISTQTTRLEGRMDAADIRWEERDKATQTRLEGLERGYVAMSSQVERGDGRVSRLEATVEKLQVGMDKVLALVVKLDGSNERQEKLLSEQILPKMVPLETLISERDVDRQHVEWLGQQNDARWGMVKNGGIVLGAAATAVGLIATVGTWQPAGVAFLTYVTVGGHWLAAVAVAGVVGVVFVLTRMR